MAGKKQTARKKGQKKSPIVITPKEELKPLVAPAPSYPAGLVERPGPPLSKRCLTCAWFEVISENGVEGCCHDAPAPVKKRVNDWCRRQELAKEGAIR